MTRSAADLANAPHPDIPAAPPPDRPLLGIGLMLASVALLPIMDGFAKAMADSFAITQLVWARFLFQSLLIVPLALGTSPKAMLRPSHLPLQLARGVGILIGTFLFFSAIRTMPIADALALLFIAPLIVTALSPLVLGEAVGIRRWMAVLVGFGGALVVLRPGLTVLQPGALLALGAGASFAGYVLLTRRLSHAAPPLVTLAITSLVGLVATSALLPAVWVTPQPMQLAAMAAMGAIGAGGHYLMIRAFEKAPASLLAPFGYGEILTATIVGYYWFGDFPDGATWLGIAILIASGIYISVRERVRREETGH
ncbi:Permeases of the drug/metabolite transporter (DMT) superfamily protein [alpha proteobacterium BAL199]|jgi:drug/metabolite transporter (DMT)-like permease|nr:Permeases of the drug/metabolite transporter (DMT) superfamily protein [alpha proteobacterium BAL199]